MCRSPRSQSQFAADRPHTGGRLFLHFVLGVDDVVILLAVAAARAGMGAGGTAVGLGFGGRAAAATRGGAALVHLLGEFVADLLEVVHRLADAVGVVALAGFAEV